MLFNAPARKIAEGRETYARDPELVDVLKVAIIEL
jgi:hypothetical protein